MIRNSRSDSSPVSAAVGSSMTKMRAGAVSSSRKAAAILTSIRSPTGSFETIVSGRDVLDAERGKRRARARVERPPIDEAEAARIGAAEKDVLGHAEARDDVQFLMDEAQAAPMRLVRAAERSRRAVDPDLAAVGRDRAGEDLDQRALAGAVLAHQRERLAGAEFERSVPQRRRAAIGLAQMADRKQAHGASRRRGPPARRRLLLLHVLRGDERRRHIDHALLDLLAGEMALDQCRRRCGRCP